MTTKSVIATIKSGVGSSLSIVLDRAHQIGDVISFNNITDMVPSGEDRTHFFYKSLQFCKENGSRLFRIDHILNNDTQRYELIVSPVPVI